MKLTASQIRYLLAVYRLCENGAVRSTLVANSLDVTRPSVHRMIRQLDEKGLIRMERYSSIRITQDGRALAQQYDACYSRICSLLSKDLKLPAACAEEGALAILGVLSMEKLGSACVQ